jgi:hypothetical protein
MKTPVVPRAELETDPDRRLIDRPHLRDRVTQVLRTAPARQAAVFVGLVYPEVACRLAAGRALTGGFGMPRPSACRH